MVRATVLTVILIADGINHQSHVCAILNVQPNQALIWLQSQPTFDYNNMRDPKWEVSSWDFPKYLIHKIVSKVKWLFSAVMFWSNLLLSNGNQDMESDIKCCSGEVEPLGGIDIF